MDEPLSILGSDLAFESLNWRETAGKTSVVEIGGNVKITWTKSLSTLATTAAIDGDPSLLVGPGWVTSIPTIIVFCFVSHLIALASSCDK
jgi:hypothetical protein